jgi:selenocysteine-specific translation elongation factor
MGNIIVAVLGKQGYSSNLAKKGTTTDITLYNLKKGKDTVTFIEPTRYPDRLAPLFYACSLAQKAIVVVDELNPNLGEALIMLECCKVENGYFVLRNYIPKDKIEPLVRNTIMEKYEFVSDEPHILKERLFSDAKKITYPEHTNNEIVGTVPVDHSFNVKGVGAVILGVVTNGTIKKHVALNVLPGKKKTQPRSIQKHDDEFDLAYEGDRVGLALKNVKVEEVERGTVLTNDSTIRTSKHIDSKATLTKYWSTPLKEGMVLHVGHWMQVLNSKIEAVNNEKDWRTPKLKLTFEKEMVYRPEDTAVLMYLEGGNLRVAGTVILQ